MIKGQIGLNPEKMHHLKTNINDVPQVVREFERKRIEQGKIVWLTKNPPNLFYSIIRASTITEYEKSGGKFNLVFVEEDTPGNLVRRCGISSLVGSPNGVSDELLETFQELF